MPHLIAGEIKNKKVDTSGINEICWNILAKQVSKYLRVVSMLCNTYCRTCFPLKFI